MNEAFWLRVKTDFTIVAPVSFSFGHQMAPSMYSNWKVMTMGCESSADFLTYQSSRLLAPLIQKQSYKNTSAINKSADLHGQVGRIYCWHACGAIFCQSSKSLIKYLGIISGCETVFQENQNGIHEHFQGNWIPFFPFSLELEFISSELYWK